MKDATIAELVNAYLGKSIDYDEEEEGESEEELILAEEGEDEDEDYDDTDPANKSDDNKSINSTNPDVS